MHCWQVTISCQAAPSDVCNMKTSLAFNSIVLALVSWLSGDVKGQTVFFNFDNAPLYSTLPIDQTMSGVTAHFSSGSIGYNYSIQRADVLGFTPAGFSGNCIYPNQVYLCDLLISFDHALTAISLMYSPEEYATDSSCTMRITAYLGTTYVGTNTFTIAPPGTWPVGTLSFHSAQPFDNVIVHYDAPPITGGDYGPIFMVDNVLVTEVPALTRVVSRMMHGSAGTFDLDITAGNAIECRRGSLNNAYTLVFGFSNDIASCGTASTGIVAAGPGPNECSVVVNVPTGQHVTVQLSNVTDVNAITTTASAMMGVLVADTNWDGFVDAIDTSQTKSQSGNAVTQSNFREDVNADGFIDAIDVALVKSRSGTSLPVAGSASRSHQRFPAR